jgi:hypothetical protein
MWAVANALRLHGISAYCGLMVRTDGWQQKWFGKLNKVTFFLCRRASPLFSRRSVAGGVALGGCVMRCPPPLNQAKFAIVMLSDVYWQSGAAYSCLRLCRTASAAVEAERRQRAA